MFNIHETYKFIRMKKCHDLQKPYDLQEIDTMEFRGDLALTDEDNDSGLLDRFKKFCLMVGYSSHCIERIVYLEENQEVVDKEKS